MTPVTPQKYDFSHVILSPAFVDSLKWKNALSLEWVLWDFNGILFFIAIKLREDNEKKDNELQSILNPIKNWNQIQ